MKKIFTILLIFSSLFSLGQTNDQKGKYGLYRIDSLYGNFEQTDDTSGKYSVMVDPVTFKIFKGLRMGDVGGGGGALNLSWNSGTHSVDISGGGTSAVIPFATTGVNGLLSTTTQTIPGIKTFSNAIQADDYIEWKSGTGSVMGVLANRSSGADDFGSVQFYNDLNANIVHFSILTPTAARNINLPDASGTVALKQDEKSKSAFAASPTSADTIDVWQTKVAITVTSIVAILRGSSSPSVTYNIGFGTNIQSPTAVFTADITCTSITTGCSNSSGFNDATIPAGSFIWIYTTAQSGTVRSIAFTINYTED